MKNDCKIIEDLLPNYLENLTSEETNDYIETHLKNCSKCSEAYTKMAEEIKVNSIDAEKEVNYMKKYNDKINNLKIYKKILIIIGVIFFIYLIFVIYKYGILIQIQETAEKSEEPTNIYLYSENKNVIIESWQKDGIIKQNMKAKNNNGDITLWINTNTKEAFWIWNLTKTYTKYNGLVYTQLQTSTTTQMDNFKKFLLIANPMTNIKNIRYDDKNCYYLELGGIEEIIEKETGILLYRNESNAIINSDSTLSNNYDKFIYELNIVTDENITEPNLSDYKYVEN